MDLQRSPWIATPRERSDEINFTVEPNQNEQLFVTFYLIHKSAENFYCSASYPFYFPHNQKEVASFLLSWMAPNFIRFKMERSRYKRRSISKSPDRVLIYGTKARQQYVYSTDVIIVVCWWWR